MLIAMAVYDTEENGRTELTRQTLLSLMQTVDWERHRLFVSDNGSCPATHELYEEFDLRVIFNGKNLGTAKAINRAWRYRKPGESCVKMDNDVVIHQADWADWMEDVFERDPEIGICGLKRKDLLECPWAENGSWFKSKVYMLPHEPGQRWLVVEEVDHVIGTCQGYSSALLDKIGYLNQPGVYGFDDCLASARAAVAGYKRVFLHGFEIDHLNVPDVEYTEWKHKEAARDMATFCNLKKQYQSGELSVYHDA